MGYRKAESTQVRKFRVSRCEERTDKKYTPSRSEKPLPSQNINNLGFDGKGRETKSANKPKSNGNKSGNI